MTGLTRPIPDDARITRHAHTTRQLAEDLRAHTRPLLDEAIGFNWTLVDLVAIAYLRGLLAGAHHVRDSHAPD